VTNAQQPDNTDPVISAITVNPNPATPGDQVSIDVDASDDSGFTTEIIITNSDGEVVHQSANSSTNWTAGEAGDYVIEVIVTDKSGNANKTSSTKTLSVKEGNNGGGGTTPSDPDVFVLVAPTNGEVIVDPSRVVLDITVYDASVDLVRYNLYDPNGDFIPMNAFAGSGFDADFIPLMTGRYTMTILAYATDANGAKVEVASLSSSFILEGDINLEANLEATLGGSDVAIYPVPASELANVSFTPNMGGEATVELMNMNGALVHVTSANVSSGSALIQVNVNELPTGVYLARISLNGEVVVKKMIVE
jgi:hypothetical protein